MGNADLSKPIKTVSSRLTAQFKADGSHLDRYMRRAPTITSSICEELILNDHIYIPTPDYLTAVGLLKILGERSFIELLERRRISFIRTRCVLAFVRGNGPEGGLITFYDPKNARPQDCDLEQSIHYGLQVISSSIKEEKLVSKLLLQASIPEETLDILSKVEQESIEDFKQSSFWSDKYLHDYPTHLRLPGIGKMSVMVSGASENPGQGPVEFLLASALKNADFYLSQKYECQNISPFHPVGDYFSNKSRRTNSSDISRLIEIMGAPNFSEVDFTQEETFRDFVRVTESKNACDFRKWFSSVNPNNPDEILKEYVRVLQEVPWIQKLPSKLFRFVAVSAIGAALPLAVAGSASVALGTATGIFDSFVLDGLFKQKSPKCFIDDLTKFSEKKRLT